jgi:glutamate 5-kinase
MSIENSKRIVIKIGSSLIVDQKGSGLRDKWLKSLVDDIMSLKKRGKEVIIVTSGSVALGKKYIKYGKNGLKLEEKQAAAACGQPELVRHYQKFFNEHGVQAAQILLTLFDSESRRNYLNAKSTLEVLLANGVVPIINENDTVATHELRFGDNDRLAARVAQMSSSELLILLSDVDGLYTANPRLDSSARHIAEVDEITKDIEEMAGEAITSGVGSGGMITKIAAAKMAMSSGCNVVLTIGTNDNPVKAFEEGGRHTLFISHESPIKARKRWIASSLKILGEVVVDNGAVRALKSGNSLLPAGVVDIKGDFKRGDTIEIKDCKLKKIGMGISAYSSRDARMIMGHKSQDIENLVGFSGRNELIHRDNMVVEIDSTVKAEE